jgi:hypothetical protein
MVNILRIVVLNTIAVILILPLVLGLIDLWTLIVFDYELILNWDQKKFTGSLMLAAIGIFAKLIDWWTRT